MRGRGPGHGARAGEAELTAGPLDGAAVAITGSAAGLGRAYALACAEAGAGVVVADLDGTAAEAVAARIRGAGGRAIALRHDVRDPAAAEELAALCVSSFGRIDGFVANAGLMRSGDAVDVDAVDVAEMLATNVAGVVHGATAAMRAMRAAGTGGSIVTVASGALQGLAGLSLYGATKGAVMSLTYAWALEGADAGIRCNAIAPLAHTAMSVQSSASARFPGGRPESVAPAVVHLLSAASAPMTGQIVRFDGRRLGLMDPPQLSSVAQRESWDAAAVAAALDGVLAEAIAPVGLLASPRPRWV
ncbi:SDR family oxidoreductase [Microbacterium capsulatum]|uniref:SDR family oxidoreductase n=1 Tax=Microbacterium capsulatum TaxID=3041921 RepID=A0ABU0XHL9_9MICO|nr:SDR family oxidoreductase [Microbacterium sp. ASV81]MDQ4213660.1 SDR family oxidoreductase [Microbacterium sp. ASV81]